MNDAMNNNEQKYLIFLLEQNLYGLLIDNVTEILEYQVPTKIPNVPLYVHGLFNLRGKVLPIIDLGVYFGQNSTKIFKKTCIVVINYQYNNQQVYLGILVDDVVDVIDIPTVSLEKVPDINMKIKAEFVKSMFILREKIVMLLDINQVFSEKALNIIADIPSK